MNSTSHTTSSARKAGLLSFAGIVFYCSHILQQAQARDQAVLQENVDVSNDHNDNLTAENIMPQSMDDLDVHPISESTVASVNLSIVNVNDEVSGKDAIAVEEDDEDGGAGIWLLLGGAAVIGGAVAAGNGGGSSSTQDSEDPVDPVDPVVNRDGYQYPDYYLADKYTSLPIDNSSLIVKQVYTEAGIVTLSIGLDDSDEACIDIITATNGESSFDEVELGVYNVQEVALSSTYKAALKQEDSSFKDAVAFSFIDAEGSLTANDEGEVAQIVMVGTDGESEIRSITIPQGVLDELANSEDIITLDAVTMRNSVPSLVLTQPQETNGIDLAMLDLELPVDRVYGVDPIAALAGTNYATLELDKAAPFWSGAMSDRSDVVTLINPTDDSMGFIRIEELGESIDSINSSGISDDNAIIRTTPDAGFSFDLPSARVFDEGVILESTQIYNPGDEAVSTITYVSSVNGTDSWDVLAGEYLPGDFYPQDLDGNYRPEYMLVDDNETAELWIYQVGSYEDSSGITYAITDSYLGFSTVPFFAEGYRDSDLANVFAHLDAPNINPIYGDVEGLLSVNLVMSYANDELGIATANFDFNQIQTAIQQSAFISAQNHFDGTPEIVSFADGTGWMKAYVGSETSESNGIVVSQVKPALAAGVGLLGVGLVQEEIDFPNEVVIDIQTMAEGLAVLSQSESGDLSQTIRWIGWEEFPGVENSDDLSVTALGAVVHYSSDLGSEVAYTEAYALNENHVGLISEDGQMDIFMINSNGTFMQMDDSWDSTGYLLDSSVTPLGSLTTAIDSDGKVGIFSYSHGRTFEDQVADGLVDFSIDSDDDDPIYADYGATHTIGFTDNTQQVFFKMTDGYFSIHDVETAELVSTDIDLSEGGEGNGTWGVVSASGDDGTIILSRSADGVTSPSALKLIKYSEEFGQWVDHDIAIDSDSFSGVSIGSMFQGDEAVGHFIALGLAEGSNSYGLTELNYWSNSHANETLLDYQALILSEGGLSQILSEGVNAEPGSDEYKATNQILFGAGNNFSESYMAVDEYETYGDVFSIESYLSYVHDSGVDLESESIL